MVNHCPRALCSINSSVKFQLTIDQLIHFLKAKHFTYGFMNMTGSINEFSQQWKIGET